MKKNKCVRCGHEWWPRTPEKPRNCGKCKVAYWWRPARVAKQRQPGPVGAPRKYPVDTIEIGQSVLLPWHRDAVDMTNYERKNRSMNMAVRSYARRAGKEFIMTGEPSGLRVYRKS